VSAAFYGNSKRSQSTQFPGDVDLGELNLAFEPGAPAVVPARTFDRKLLDRIYDRTPAVNLNIYSSRKVFKYNILDCSGPPDGPLTELIKGGAGNGQGSERA
jgi:hypothetical protein